jgi:hypothetical protein
MIAREATMTAMMMMIPMLMAAIIGPPPATISPRLACAKPDKEPDWSCSWQASAT